MDTGNRFLSSIRRVPPFLIALIAQILVSALFAPWDAPTDIEFYRGAKRLLVAGLIVHVIIRFALPRWLRGTTPRDIPEQDTALSQVAGSRFGPWRVVFRAFAGAMAITLACAMAADKGLIGKLTGTVLCIAAQQLTFATAAFNLQQPAVTQGVAGRHSGKLVVICLLALYFSVVVPSLFAQIATGKAVPNDAANLIFAIPVILVALLGLIRARFHRR